MKRLIPAVVLALLLGACGDDDGGLDPDVRPVDLSVDYSWYEGSVAPPYHYEFDIDVRADGSGTIRYRPDYGSEPEWVEAFTVSDADLDSLYWDMYDAGVFTRDWREDDEPPVGGSVAGMTVIAAGKEYRIPLDLADAGDREAVIPVYGNIEGLVPTEIWRGFEALRDDYMATYDG
jgi:hypothetical protein